MFWRALSGGVSVAVKVHPRSRRPGVQTAAGDRLRIAVTEPPEDGRANRAVCAAIADLLHVAPSAVSVTAGASSREKTLRVTGDPAALSARLAAL
ncbi:MAG TPA: DUF167 domain-containing protein [Acetobacteraceae bacterium]|nr:DUF167 domain-containing protein [Acetobacteraceae bacterium]